MTEERKRKIANAIWALEIELDSTMCKDGGEDEETKEKAEYRLPEVTYLRRRLQRDFAFTY